MIVRCQRNLSDILRAMCTTCLHAMLFGLCLQKHAFDENLMNLIALEDSYILVHKNVMLILFLHALFIVYLAFCVEHVQFWHTASKLHAQ